MFRGRIRAISIVGLFALAATIACGLTVMGSADDVSTSGDGGPGAVDDATPPSNGLGDGGAEEDANAVFGGIDASQENCLAGCDGGGCDAGWCVFSCDLANDCTRKVVCPPGIPCAINCGGPSSCSGAVDCSAASACALTCQGPNSCTGRITCSGAACNVRCGGNVACDKVFCDAGACNVGCDGVASCSGGVACNANTCTVDCSGQPPAAGKPTCDDGVDCTATGPGALCNIGCTATLACSGRSVDVVSENIARVRCDGTNTCLSGVKVSAGDASIDCEGVNACGGTNRGIKCDGGHCAASCEGTIGNLKVCCQSTKCTNNDGDDCDLSTAGCN